MKTVQELIRQFIDSNGHTIYSISQQSGINRTTLQKIISGQRKVTKEIFDAITPFFILSPNEQEELNHAFLIEEIGRERYQTHMAIKDILELPNSTFHQTSPVLSDTMTIKSDKLTNNLLIENSYPIINIICSIMLDNIKTEESPYMYTFTDMSHPFMSSLLKQFFNNAYEKLTIRHLIEFHKARFSNGNYENTYNLKLINTLLPFFSAFPGSFSVYYYYSSKNENELPALIFPYYIITNSHIILLSTDYEHALLIQDSAIHDHYKNCYEQTLEKSNLLTNGVQSSLELLDNLNTIDPSTNYPICLNVQPTIEQFITEEMIDKYMIDTPFKLVLREKLLKRIEQLSTEEHTILFTQEGLHLFSEQGKNVNFPDSLARPFDAEDRITILSKFIECNQSQKANTFLMINPKKLHTSLNICIAFVPPAVTYLFLIRNDGNAMVIPLHEHTICSSIMDYIQMFPEYGYVYSLEETNQIIQNEIEKLQTIV